MEEAWIKITKEEADILPLLLKVEVKGPLGAIHTLANMEAAAMTLIKKANQAFDHPPKKRFGFFWRIFGNGKT